MPGPTAYDVRTNPINKRTFTLKGRTKLQTSNKIPLGPGEYPIKSLFGSNNCLFLSNIKFIGQTKIAPVTQSQSRLRNIIKNQKEPELQYDFKYQIQSNGKYFNSRIRSVACPKLVKQQNVKNENRDENLGPGEYVVPSDFGIYQSSLFSKPEKDGKIKL